MPADYTAAGPFLGTPVGVGDRRGTVAQVLELGPRLSPSPGSQAVLRQSPVTPPDPARGDPKGLSRDGPYFRLEFQAGNRRPSSVWTSFGDNKTEVIAETRIVGHVP